MALKIFVPVRLISEANAAGSVRGQINRKKLQKNATVAAFIDAGCPVEGIIKMRGGQNRLTCKLVSPPEFPLVVTMTRIAPRELDDDNLVRSFKTVRDKIADLLNIDDRDKRVTWVVAQRRGAAKQYAFEVIIDGRR